MSKLGNVCTTHLKIAQSVYPTLCCKGQWKGWQDGWALGSKWWVASLVCTLGKWLALQHGCLWADPNGEQRGSIQSSDILKHKPQKICDITTSHTIRQSHLPFNPIVHLMKYCLTNAIYKLTSHLMVRYWIFSPLTAEAMEDITSLT